MTLDVAPTVLQVFTKQPRGIICSLWIKPQTQGQKYFPKDIRIRMKRHWRQWSHNTLYFLLQGPSSLHPVGTLQPQAWKAEGTVRALLPVPRARKAKGLKCFSFWSRHPLGNVHLFLSHPSVFWDKSPSSLAEHTGYNKWLGGQKWQVWNTKLSLIQQTQGTIIQGEVGMLSEDLSWPPGFPTLCNSPCRGSDGLFWFLLTACTRTQARHPYAQHANKA